VLDILQFFQTFRNNIFLPPIFLLTTDGPAAKSSDMTSSKAPSAQNLMAWDASSKKQRVVISLLFMITSTDSSFLGREIKESSDENLSHLKDEVQYLCL
jgi:hypothetical protein